MRIILAATVALLPMSHAAAQTAAAPERSRMAESPPENLVEMIRVNDAPGNASVQLSTQFVIIAERMMRPPMRSVGLLRGGLLGGAMRGIGSAMGVQPGATSNTNYLVASIDRATGIVTYRVHYTRSGSSLQNLIPEFLIKFGDTQEATQDTKGWRSSGYCSQGYWSYNSAFHTQTYIPPVCSYEQRYDFAISQAMIDKAAASYPGSKYTLLSAGYTGYWDKANEATFASIVAFYPSEMKALQFRVDEEKKKLAAAAQSASPPATPPEATAPPKS